MSATSRNLRAQGSVAALVVAIISVVVALALFTNRQAILDQVSVWQYQPEEQILSFANRASMSETGRFNFFASQPSLDNRQEFQNHCPSSDPQTAILGCYTAQRIYIYDVQNDKLNGIRTVTAAHEMLHAVYERLDDDERAMINTLLEDEYDKLKNDKKLAARMAFYAKTEPGQRNNELFSVIGTEIPNISSELEQFYQTYFTDRQKVIALHASYESVFNQLQVQAEQLRAQITALQTDIEQDSTTYNNMVEQLNADIVAFNGRASSGDFDDRTEFNQERTDLLARADQLDALRTQIDNNIIEINALQNEFANVAVQSDELNRSINSSLAPAPSL